MTYFGDVIWYHEASSVLPTTEPRDSLELKTVISKNCAFFTYALNFERIFSSINTFVCQNVVYEADKM